MKATISLSLETILKIVLVTAFLFGAIFLLIYLQTGSLKNISILNATKFFENLFGIK